MMCDDRPFNAGEERAWDGLKENAEALLVSHANLHVKVQVLEDKLIKIDQQLRISGLYCLTLEKTAHELRDVNTGLVMTVVDLRSALRECGQHVVLCPQSLPPDERPCDCGLDDEIRS